MPICERCSATFEQPKSLTSVASLRVLCPPCLAAHQAARASRVRETGEEQVTARPATVAQKRAGTENATRAAVGEPRAPAKRAAPARAAPAPAPERKRSIDLDELPSRQVRSQGSREVIFGLVAAVVVFAAAGFVFWKVKARKEAEAAVVQARLDEIERFRAEFTALDVADEQQATRLIQLANERKAVWSETELASEVVGRTAKAKTFLEVLAEQRTLEQRLADVEGVLARAAELGPTELADQRRRLDELAGKAPVVGDEFVERVAAARGRAEEAYVESVQSSAREAASADPLDRTKLVTIQQAEDQILALYEERYRAWQNAPAPKPDAIVARKTDMEARYKDVIALSDTAVARFFTPDVVANVPWRDLLAPEHAGEWKGATVKGFEFRVADGELHMIGPDAAEKSEGIISIGDKEAWRDLELDLEVTVVRGQCTLFFRLPRAYQENVEYVDFTTEEGYLEAGRTYEYSFRLIGSTLVEEMRSADSLGPEERKLSWTQTRKGALGISLPKDSEVRFSRLRVKVLR